LYWKAPTAALHEFVGTQLHGPPNAEKVQAIRWADHLSKTRSGSGTTAGSSPGSLTRAELDKIAQFPEWQVKLYVAEMLRRHPELRRKPTLERLRADPVALVAKAADVPFHFGKADEERFLWWLP
jgi:hypothetical protein